ncbi:MAG: anti-sigma factor [Actinomycetota bacterium]
MTDNIDFMNDGSGDVRELDELLGAYALDAVDPDEARRVEDYLASNPRAADEVQQHREVATMLAFTGMDAPDGVWERITDELEGGDDVGPSGSVAGLLPFDPPDADRRVAAGSGSPTAAPVTGEQSDSGEHRDNVVPFRRRRAGTFLLGAAAAAVLAISAVVVLDGRASAPTDPIAEAYEVARDAAGAQVTDLAAAGSDVTATGVIGLDGQGYIDASSLPSLDEEQTYQLWGVLSDTGDVVSIGILGADPALETFTVDGIGVDALAITIEQAPGVISDGNPDGAYVGTFG